MSKTAFVNPASTSFYYYHPGDGYPDQRWSNQKTATNTDKKSPHSYLFSLNDRGDFQANCLTWNADELKKKINEYSEKAEENSVTKLSKLIDKFYFIYQPLDIPQPDIDLDSEGEISLVWSNKEYRRSLSICAIPDKPIKYLDVIISDSKKAYIYEGIDDTIILKALRWLQSNKNESWSNH